MSYYDLPDSLLLYFISNLTSGTLHLSDMCTLFSHVVILASNAPFTQAQLSVKTNQFIVLCYFLSFETGIL